MAKIERGGVSVITIENWPVARFIPYARNPRKNDEVVDQMVAAIKEFGFRIPIIARSDGTIVDGHLRLKAAQRLRRILFKPAATSPAKKPVSSPMEGFASVSCVC